jgi:hypothetical protein
MDLEKIKQEVIESQAEALSRGDFRDLHDFVSWAFRDLTPEQWKAEHSELVGMGYIEKVEE